MFCFHPAPKALAGGRRRPARRLTPRIDSLEERLALTASPLANVGLTAGWATFGQALPQGAARTGLQVGTLSTQTDVKTRWPDGSIKFAIVTASVPTAGTYALTEGPASSGTVVPSLPNAEVDLTIGGVVYAAKLPSSLGTDTWLAGPLASEGRTVVTPTTASGQAHPFLRVIFDTRAFADGGDRLDVTVENTLDQAGATAVTYNVAIVANGQTLFQRSNVVHSYLTRWRQVFDVNGLKQSTETPDFQPMIAAGAIPAYMSSIYNVVSTPTGGTYDILGRGANTYNDMSTVGGREEIAPYPDWTARYLVHRDPNQGKFVMANGDLAGSWPVHIVEPAGGKFTGVGSQHLVSIDERPNFWLDARGQDKPAGNLGATGPLLPDNAHVPSLAYVPYLVTGDRYYADEMKYWANYVLLSTFQDPYYNERQGSDGILQGNQVRGIAWGLRNLVDAASYLPDSDPTKAYLAAKIQKNLSWLDNYANTHVTPLGTLWENKRPEGNGIIATWEQNYLAWSIDHANAQGFTGGLAHRDKLVKFQNLLFNSDPGFSRANAAPYTIRVGTPKPDGSLASYTTASQLNTEIDTVPFSGYYGVDARLSLMTGIRSGLAGAQAAYDYLQPQITGDLNDRAGWAIALTPSTPVTPPTDTIAPTVTAQTPGIGATDVATSTAITATFSEALQTNSAIVTLTNTATGGSVAGTLTYNTGTLTATFVPSTSLTAGTTYAVGVSGARDLAGNQMTPVSWNFTTTAPTPPPGGSWVQSTVSDFSTGQFTGVTTTNLSGGELTLAPGLYDNFTSGSLNPNWLRTNWINRSSVSFNNGIVQLVGTQIRSSQVSFGGVQGRINLAAGAQHQFGLATNLQSATGNSWAVFTTGSTSNQLFAQVNVQGTLQTVALGGLPSGYHTYRVDRTATGFEFRLDDALVATIQARLPGTQGLRAVLSSSTPSWQPALKADWVQLIGVVSSGMYQSAVQDAGRTVTWGVASWMASLPAGTSLTVEACSSVDGTTWSSWSAVTNNSKLSSPSGRYLRYRLQLATTDNAVAPTLQQIQFNWS